MSSSEFELPEEPLAPSDVLFPGASWIAQRTAANGVQLHLPMWGMGDALVSLVGFIGISLVATIGMVLMHIDPEHGIGVILSTTLPWIALGGWPIYASMKKGNGIEIDFGFVYRKEHLRLGIVAALVGLLLAGLVAVIVQKLIGPISAAAVDLASDESLTIRIVFGLLAMFGAPFVEELAFRGLLYGSLTKAMVNEHVAVLITSAAFALFHFEPQRFFILFTVGYILTEIRRRSGSVFASYIAHLVNNAPAAIALMLGVQSLAG